jgi:glyoxylase-like metal-dependent hydrolase (beta-lactamase superfamily II)
VRWEHRAGNARLVKLSVGEYDNNAYVLTCERARRAVVIDAAAEAPRILAETEGYEVLAILTTHGHFDHLQAVDEVKHALGVPFRMHRADTEIAGRTPDLPLTDGQEIEVGDVLVHVVHTPGHTPGSVCFVVEPWLMSGDTLFPGGPGATRWEYSDFGQIMDSLERRLFTLPDPTVVFPGHGADTTLGEERPEIPAWRARGW